MKQIKKYLQNRDHDSIKNKLKSYSALAASFVAFTPLSNDLAAQCPTDVNPDAVLNNSTFAIDFDGDATIDLTIGQFNSSFSNPQTFFAGSSFVTAFLSSTTMGSTFFFTAAGFLYNYYTFLNSGFTFNSAYATIPAGNGLLGFSTASNPLANGDAICSTAAFNTGALQLANSYFRSFTSSSSFTITSYYFVSYQYYIPNSSYNIFYTTFSIGSNVLSAGGTSTTSQNGNFNGTTQYVGVEFDVSGSTHYGWVELQIDPTTSQVTILSYGYNPTAGDCIPAGQCVVACAADNGTPSFVSP